MTSIKRQYIDPDARAHDVPVMTPAELLDQIAQNATIPPPFGDPTPFGDPPPFVRHLPANNDETIAAESEAENLLETIAALLGERYEPAGMLTFWGASITYLDGRRPCEVWRERDLDGLRTLAQRLNAITDGPFA